MKSTTIKKNKSYSKMLTTVFLIFMGFGLAWFFILVSSSSFEDLDSQYHSAVDTESLRVKNIDVLAFRSWQNFAFDLFRQFAVSIRERMRVVRFRFVQYRVLLEQTEQIIIFYIHSFYDYHILEHQKSFNQILSF